MALSGRALEEAERRRYIAKGIGFFPKQIFKLGTKKAARESEFRPLSDEAVKSLLAAGLRVHDKQRGIYVHI